MTSAIGRARRSLDGLSVGDAFGERFFARLETVQRMIEQRAETAVSVVAERVGNGRGVIAPDTVPLTIWCAATYLGRYEEAMWQTVSALGDRDTTCAIVGGILSLHADAVIPEAWLAAREPLEAMALD